MKITSLRGARALAFGLLAATGLATAELPLPEPSGDAVRWQAEAAESQDWELVDDPRADDGRYARASGEDGTLTFRFTATEPMTLSLRPVWWLHGDRKPARRFPDPLPRSFGAGAVAAQDHLLFFAAPATGRVGVYDMKAEQMLEPIELDGYPADILLAANGRLYVADASRDRVTVIDPERREIVGEIEVPGRPWSLARHGDRLLVACFTGRKVVAIDTAGDEVAGDEVVGEQDVAGVPLGITTDGDGVVFVERAPMVFDPETLAERMPDRLEYVLQRYRKDAAGWPAPLPLEKPEKSRMQQSLTSPEPGKLSYPVRGVGPEIDLAEITEPALDVEAPDWLEVGPGPTAIDQSGRLAFFNAVQAGRVGVYDLEEWELLSPVEVGGLVSDLSVDDATGKLYALDATANEVVVIDGSDPKVLGRVAVPTGPAQIECGSGKAFVLGRDSRTLTVIDTADDEVVHSVELPFAPRDLRKVRLYPDYVVNPHLWQPAAADAPDVLLIELPPLTLDAGTLDAHANPKRSKPFDRPNLTVFEKRAYQPEPGAHAIRVSERAPIDTSSVTDPQRLPEPAALRPGDVPGTLAFRLDEEAALDWTRGIWVTPDDGTYLVNDTDEFRRWNAPRIRIAPGEHTLRVEAGGPHARLDAVELRRVGDAGLDLTVRPLPVEAHGEVRLPDYFGTFAHGEASEFEIGLNNAEERPVKGELRASVTDHRGRPVAEKVFQVNLDPGNSNLLPWTPEVTEPGVYDLHLVCDTDAGSTRRNATFVRLPELEHPRLIFRKAETEAIRERMAANPLLFRRYRQWLHWRLETETLLPSLDELKARYPTSDYKNEANKWPVIAVQAMAMLDEGGDFTEAAETLKEYAVGGYKTFGSTTAFLHNCFPSVTACLQDMRALDSEEALEGMRNDYDESLGNSDVLAESLLSIREPLTPRMRAVAARHGKWQGNVRRYFAAHAGRRGGNWWLTHRTGCCCPLHGVARSMLFTWNFFAMDDMFDDVAFGGLFTHHAYAHPYENKRGALPSFLHGGEGRGSCVMRSVVPAIARNPLLPDRGIWSDIVRHLQDPEADDADVLAALDGYPEHAAVVPLFIALGWYDPEVPEVALEELPPTILFDGEGEAVMQSDWTPDRTRLYFASGPRDMIYRWHAGHLEIMKNGELLLGSGSLGTDHGQPTPAWANTVVVGDDWQQWWLSGMGHRRGMNQLQVMDRHTPAAEAYVERNKRLAGYSEPGGAGRGYTLGLHTHARHPFIEEGRLVGWQTSPSIDYVAGDMTHAWDPKDVVEATRQVVFLKPDVVAVYDRVALTETDQPTRWMAATGPELDIEGRTFTVANREARLHGRVLLPAEAALTDIRDESRFDDFRWQVPQRVLSVQPVERKTGVADYLVVMQAGSEGGEVLPVTEAIDEDFAAVTVETEEGPVTLRFRRSGEPGASIVRDGTEEPLADEVEDHYARWSEDPRHASWTGEKRFDFLRIDR
ncbi:MAG: hypothetical protein WD342_12485 [Verrucomicrobiales bacterium]